MPRGERLAPPALARLADALAEGEAGGFLRVFLDEGALLQRMLRALRTRPAGASPGYLDGVLAAFPRGAAPGALTAGGLVEGLTQRESEVLGLMAAGLSNREMAARLVLSEGTVKTHVHNLIAKLEAQSRTHALARAKELGLL